MSDNDVRDLARRAGVELKWTDYADKPREVPLDAVRNILAALGMPCQTTEDIAQSRRTLNETGTPRLVTALVEQPIGLPSTFPSDNTRAQLITEDGSRTDLNVTATANGVRLPAVKVVGYHHLEIGNKSFALAVAPSRCFSIENVAPGKRLCGPCCPDLRTASHQ